MALKGKALPPGGTVGVPAPAWPYYNRSEVLRGVEWWESKGYKVKLGDGIYARRGYVAGDPKQRANDIVAMFDDVGVDLVQWFSPFFSSLTTRGVGGEEKNVKPFFSGGRRMAAGRRARAPGPYAPQRSTRPEGRFQSPRMPA
jgi:hypothetical protein